MISTEYEHFVQTNNFKNDHEKFNPRAGFSYILSPSLNFFGNYSQEIRSVQLSRPPFLLKKNLEPEKIESFEAGVRGELAVVHVLRPNRMRNKRAQITMGSNNSAFRNPHSTFSEAIEVFCDRLSAEDRSPATIDAYRRDLALVARVAESETPGLSCRQVTCSLLDRVLTSSEVLNIASGP